MTPPSIRVPADLGLPSLCTAIAALPSTCHMGDLTSQECSKPPDCRLLSGSSFVQCLAHVGNQINTGLTKTTVIGDSWDPTEAQGGPACTSSQKNAEEGAE